VADRKISDLTALTTPATGDLIPIVDISEAAAADKNKSITVGELLRGAPDGTAAAPGFAFESDGGNGMFLGGTDILAFSTGGSQAVTIDASQRLGVGTSSPTSLLTIGTASTANPAADVTVNSSAVDQYRLKLTSSAYNADTKWLGLGFGYHDNYLKAGIIAEAKDNNARTNLHFCLDGNANSDNAGLGDSKMVITYGGNVGIGTVSPSSALDIRGDLTFASSDAAYGTNYYGVLHSENAGDTGYLQFRGASGLGKAIGVAGFGTETVLFSGSTECARLNESGGRLLVGTSSARINLSPAGSTAKFQVEGTTNDTNKIAVISSFSSATNAVPAGIYLSRAGSTAIGSTTVVASGNQLGQIYFQGCDGTNFIGAASIVAEVDGTPGANDMPGRLVFSTTADGASSPTERMRITNAGSTKFYRNTSTAGDFIIFGHSDSGSTDNLRFAFRADGGLANYSANNQNLSDRNVKKDIAPAAGTWDCLKEWEIVNFRYKDQPDDSDLNMGVIAQQVAESCPEVITTFQEAAEDQPEKLGVKEQQMMWMAIKALQEAQLRIEQLEAKVAALEAS